MEKTDNSDEIVEEDNLKIKKLKAVPTYLITFIVISIVTFWSLGVDAYDSDTGKIIKHLEGTTYIIASISTSLLFSATLGTFILKIFNDDNNDNDNDNDDDYYNDDDHSS